MLERELKFTKTEIEEKHRKALGADKRTEEMVEKGEAKTPQEAIEKIEEKELEKYSEDLLKETLPLAWEEGLEFAKEKGFNSPEEIKKRIDLAKEYNLEIEHFFYEPEKLEKEMPTKEQIEKTAKEMLYVNEFAKEFSKQSKKPVFCIFNARNGTIYSYGMDTMNTQLNAQFGELAERENKTVQELRDEFVRDLKSNEYWQLAQKKEVDSSLKKIYKKRAVIEIAGEWINHDRLSFMAVYWKDFKISSFQFDPGSEGKIDSGTLTIVDQYRNMIEQDSSILVVIDASGHPRGHPLSYIGFGKTINRMQTDKSHYFLRNRSRVLKRDNIRDIINKDFKTIGGNLASVFVDVLSNPVEETQESKLIPWFDNFPQILGQIGKKYTHGGRDEEVIYPTEKIVQSAQRVEYLSEKVKNALRFYEKDERGKNWFERNGVSQENYFEMDEQGNAKVDDKGYPIPSEKAVMAKAAEDELSRIEAAMQEL